ncbi:MAG: DUF3078 domain-containing protein, partial [Gemmatimonadota bacterium]
MPSARPISAYTLRRATLCVLAVAASVLALAGPAQAQEEKQDTAKQDTLAIGKWYPEADAGINLTQSAYSNNWNGGDRGSVVWAGIVNAALQRRFNGRLAWSNTMVLAYGQTAQQTKNDAGELVWQSPTKSTDRIDIESLMQFTLGGWVNPYVAARLQSQFVDASDSAGRTLNFQPMILTQSAGIARQVFDTDTRSLLVRLGFTMRENRRAVFVNPAPDRTTIARTGLDAGTQLLANYNASVLRKRVTWNAKLSFYKPFFYSGNSVFDKLSTAQLIAAGVDPDVRSYTTATDIDWENIFTTQITKLLSINMYVRWVYDKYDNSVKPALNTAGDLTDPAGVQAAIRKAGQ